MRISAKDDFMRIRKVSIDVGHSNVVSTILSQQFYKEVIIWSMLSHPNVLGLVGAQEDIKKRQLVIISERMVYGNIMKYINENYANRLELVRDFSLSSLPPLKSNGSCTVRLKVWSTYMAPILRMGTSKGLVHLRFATDTFLTFNSRTSLCPTTSLLVPASQTSISSPQSPTLSRSCQPVRKQRAARRGSSLQNA